MPTSITNSELRLVQPAFTSNLTDLIIELDYLRKKVMAGTTPPQIFFQLKHIFHTLESIGSARIEGNNTTIAEYIETKIENGGTKSQNIIEIYNMEEALKFIDENIRGIEINRAFVSHLHKMIVSNLEIPPYGEGDLTPGEYRKRSVAINHSEHIPPDFMLVNDYMEELFNFINNQDQPKYDLLKIAIASHRFVWIHPFTNGNGRTVRLFTYALLVKQGFNVDAANRIINPTAVFCSNRDEYYDYLAKADAGTDEGLLLWCEYVLSGLKNEIEKVDKLLDFEYLKKEILYPALNFSVERKLITDEENKIFKIAIDKKVIQARDLKDIFPNKIPAEVSRKIKNLINKRMLFQINEGARKYSIRFDNNYLIRGIIDALDKKGFLPLKD